MLSLLLFLACGTTTAGSPTASQADLDALTKRVTLLEAELGQTSGEGEGEGIGEGEGEGSAEGEGEGEGSSSTLSDQVADLQSQVTDLQTALSGVETSQTELSTGLTSLTVNMPKMWSTTETNPPGGYTSDWSDITTPLELDLATTGTVMVFCQGSASDMCGVSSGSCATGTPSAAFRVVMASADGATSAGTDACYGTKCSLSMMTAWTFTPWSDAQTVSCQSKEADWSAIQVVAIQLPSDSL